VSKDSYKTVPSTSKAQDALDAQDKITTTAEKDIVVKISEGDYEKIVKELAKLKPHQFDIIRKAKVKELGGGATKNA